ncbi:hypothetical protein JRC49_09610 [Clostridiales bacterium FE2011]|nr:hypothetical protein JRC49_09610 [Clostridiales bacterium FE2011]
MRDFHMSAERFIDHVKAGYDANQRYCFILGAGASYTSGIPTGMSLMPEWRKYLEKKGLSYIEECARDCNIPKKRWMPLFQPDYKLKSEDYFILFDLRFAGTPIVAYHELQTLMENASPSIGYYMLAILMEHTENKLVITTNFDSLVEDVLHRYHTKHPLVAGHESLASFIDTVENVGRPVVAKVHRDLTFRPLNREQELRKLGIGWENSLRTALSKYIPIVIGYAGGDQTLMKLLERIDLESIYWCSLNTRESERIENLLCKSPGGYLVTIKGFDEIMFDLVDNMKEGMSFEKPTDRMKYLCDQWVNSYNEQYLKINDAVLDENTDQNSSPDKVMESSMVSDNSFKSGKDVSVANDLIPDLSFLELLDQLSDTSDNSDPVISAAQLRRSALRHYYNKELSQALELCDKAINLQPRDANLQFLKGTLLHNNGENDKALSYMIQANLLERNNSKYHYTMGVILQELERYPEARSEIKRAIALEFSNAKYHDSLSMVHLKMQEYQEALEESDTAIKLETDNPDFYMTRSMVYDKLGENKEAEKDRMKARQLKNLTTIL